MEYLVTQDKTKLDSTVYFEIGPGKYCGKHWQEGFVFASEEPFCFIEPLFQEHFPDFDHYGMNNIPSVAALQIATDLTTISAQVLSDQASVVANRFKLNEALSKRLAGQVESNKHELAKWIDDVASALQKFSSESDFICVLGL